MPNDPFVVPLIGVANPFSVAEYVHQWVHGKPLDWRIDTARSLLERTLRMPLEGLMDPTNSESWVHADSDRPMPLWMHQKSADADAYREAWTFFTGEPQSWRPAAATSQVNGAEWFEVRQGCARDCYLIAAFISLAWVRTPWADLMQTIDTQVPGGLVTSTYPSRKGGARPVVKTTLAVPKLSSTSGVLRYASSTEPTESWPALWEKAWLLRGLGETDDDRPDYGLLNNRRPDDALQAHVRHEVESHGFDDGRAWAFLKSLLDGTRLSSAAVVWTRESLFEVMPYSPRISANHAYAVLGVHVSADGEEFLIVSDPFSQNWREETPLLERARLAIEGTPWRHTLTQCGGAFAVPKEVAHRVFHGVCSYRLS